MTNKPTNCLLGGALGDSLGYPVEFSSYREIQQNNPSGITFINFSEPVLISDDTQMSLFTASALLISDNYLTNLWDCYQDWLETQWKTDKQSMSHKPVSKLVDFQELFNSREPGRTCLMTLAQQKPGSLQHPINNSKGCGGIMRVAPIGLIDEDENIIAQLGTESSALTHGHPLSSLSSAYLAVLIHRLLTSNISPQLVLDTLNFIKSKFSTMDYLSDFTEIIKLATNLSQTTDNDFINFQRLGKGWVAEETLAIALYCSLKYQKDPCRAIEISVNHDGDSDSTGSITGQIVGVQQSNSLWLPASYLNKLELRDVIISLGKKLSQKFNT